jgi:hypothetical protein
MSRPSETVEYCYTDRLGFASQADADGTDAVPERQAMVDSFGNWLKTTVLGIILLGAIGSIAALYILKLLRWLLRKPAWRVYFRVLISNLRPLLVSWLMTSRYVETKEDVKLLVNSMMLIASANVALVLFILFSVESASYFFTVGVQLTAFSFFLVTLACLSFIFLLRSTAAVAGMFSVLLLDDYLRAKELLKSKASVLGMFIVWLAQRKGKQPETGAKTPDPTSPTPTSPPKGDLPKIND